MCGVCSFCGHTKQTRKAIRYQSRAKVKRVWIICLGCNVVFDTPRSSQNRKFCTNKCYLDYVRSQSMKSNRKCRYCGGDFRSYNSKYCSRVCYYKYKRESGEPFLGYQNRICLQCGESYFGSGRKFCSRACFYKSGRKYRLCKQCGVEYHSSKAKSFCSSECARQAQVVSRVSTACLWCDEFFEHLPSESRKFCSSMCSVAFGKENLRSPGMTRYERALKSTHWARLRQKFMDNYGHCMYVDEETEGSSEPCGSTNNLQLHHLHYDSVGYETEDDVVLYCSDCHEAVHHEKAIGNGIHYGRKTNREGKQAYWQD